MQKVTAPRTVQKFRAERIAKADEVLEKLQDVRAMQPLAKIRNGSAAHLDAAIVAVAEYLDAVKGGGK